MPSPRRLRLLMLATLVTVVVILFYTSSLDSSESAKDTRTIQDFYRKTMDGINKGQSVVDSKTGAEAGRIPADTDGDGDVDDDDRRTVAGTKLRLKAAEQQAKDKANEKALRPDPPSQVVGKGNSADGQAKKPAVDDSSATKEPAAKGASQEERDAEAELNTILQRAPVVIFSKTRCPHSKRAKGILLEKYRITPDPYVVELDKHPLGKYLQALLATTTGRATVPNIMVNRKSIGGADEIVDLDNKGKLGSVLHETSKKRVDVSERFTVNNKHS